MLFDKQDSISTLKLCMLDLNMELQTPKSETRNAQFYNLSNKGKGRVKVTFHKRNESPFIDLGQLLYGFGIQQSVFNPTLIFFSYDEKSKLTIESDQFKFSLTF